MFAHVCNILLHEGLFSAMDQKQVVDAADCAKTHERLAFWHAYPGVESVATHDGTTHRIARTIPLDADVALVVASMDEIKQHMVQLLDGRPPQDISEPTMLFSMSEDGGRALIQFFMDVKPGARMEDIDVM